jgi:ATP-dependent DNA helicase RecQ
MHPPDGGSVPEQVEALLGFQPLATHERFGEPGWIYEGCCGDVACASCRDTPLHVWRCPYQSGGKTYRYWGIVCMACRSIVDLSGFDNSAKKLLREWSASLQAEAEARNELSGDRTESVAEEAGRPSPDGHLTASAADQRCGSLIDILLGEPGSWELDPSIKLDPKWEAPAWKQVRQAPFGADRWWTPQFSLNALAGTSEPQSHWVDFLLFKPGDDDGTVLEADGGGHRRSRSVDEARDRLLGEAGISVIREPGENLLGSGGAVEAALNGSSRPTREGESSHRDRRRTTPIKLEERWPRPGWSVRYTTIGGRSSSDDPLGRLQAGESTTCRRAAERLLTQAMVAVSEGGVERGPDTAYWVSVCRKVLQRGSRPPVSPRTDALLLDGLANSGVESLSSDEARLLGPTMANRLAMAIVELVAAGHLLARGPWTIALEDSTSLTERAAGGVLDTLAAIDDIWGTRVMPDEVVVGQRAWRRSHRYELVDELARPVAPQATVVLDHVRPPHAGLPDPLMPTAVIRSAHLPLRLAVLPAESTEWRRAAPSNACQQGLHHILEDLFGHTGFREGQLEAILRLLAGDDAVAILPTGLGKSLILQIAGLLRPGMTVIVDPLKQLVRDQARGMGRHGIDRVAPLTSDTLKGGAGKLLLESVGRGDHLYAYLTPERLQIQKFRDHLIEAASGCLVNLAVVDESHCVSEWGHDFRPSYLRLGRNLRDHCRGLDDHPPPILGLTATASPTVRIDMLRELGLATDDPELILTPASHERPNLHYRMVHATEESKRQVLSETIFERLPVDLGEQVGDVFKLRGPRTASGLVFVPHVRGRFGIVEVARRLRQEAERRGIELSIGIFSGSPPSNWSQAEWADHCNEVAEDFIDNEVQILVTTKAFGMGIDKPNIRWTVHYGMPDSIEAFAQESGRAGRDGLDSFCYLIEANPDRSTMARLLQPAEDAPRRKQVWDGRAGETPRPATDIDHRLWFHYGSFPGPGLERLRVKALFEEIWEAAGRMPGASGIEVPRTRWSDGAPPEAIGWSPADERERAMVRLLALGVIYDYTVQYGTPGHFRLEFEDFDQESVGEFLRLIGRELEPGRGETLEEELLEGPSDLEGRVASCIDLLIDIYYRNIEPARIRAIEEMYRLAQGNPGEEEISARIRAYLGEGLLAASLERTIRDLTDRLTPGALSELLEALPAAMGYERDGATAAFLTQHPDHPLALLAAALAEAWKPTGDQSRFRGLVGEAFASFPAYVPDADQRVDIFEKLCRHLRDPELPSRTEWCANLWDAWWDAELGDLLGVARAVLLAGYEDIDSLLESSAAFRSLVEETAVVIREYTMLAVGGGGE